MPVDLAASFSRDTRKALHMFGSWPPGEIFSVGKYGILDGNLFTALGDVSDLIGVAVSPQPFGPKLQFNFKSTGVTEGKIDAKASTDKSSPVGSAKLGAKLSFKRAGSTYFRAKDAVYQSVKNLGTINNTIMDAFAAGKWKAEWALVHGVYLAAGTTLIVSSERGGSIELEGTIKPGGSLDLADASAGIQGKNSDKIQFEIVGRTGLTPLICLSKIRPRSVLLGLLGWSEEIMRPMLSAPDSGESTDSADNDINKMPAEVTMKQAEELKVAPGELFHMVELDGVLPQGDIDNSEEDDETLAD